MAIETDNVAFIFNNAVEYSTITCSNQSTTLTSNNLKNSYRSKPYRSLNLTGPITISGTLSTPVLINSIAVIGHNIADSATVQLKLYNASNTLIYTSADLATSGSFSTTPWGELEWGYDPFAANVHAQDTAIMELYFETFTELTKRWELVITNPASMFGTYIQIRKLFLGEVFRPTYNFSAGHSYRLVDDAKLERTSAGVLLSDLATIKYRAVDFDLSVIAEVDRIRLFTEIRAIGKTKDFYISLFPDATTDKKAQYRMLAKFVEVPELVEKFNDFYSSSIRIEEA